MMATGPAAYYRYMPLAHRCIRLIRLHLDPQDGTSTNDVRIDLEHKSLGLCKYMAISYTWGAATLEEQDTEDFQIFTREATLAGAQNVYLMCGSICFLGELVMHSLDMVFDPKWNIPLA